MAVRWMGWRLRLLVLCALLGCGGVFALIRVIAAAPHIDAAWRANAQGRIELAASADPVLLPYVDRVLAGVAGADGRAVTIDAVAQRSPRWIVRDSERDRQLAMDERLATVLSQPRVRLAFADGASVEVRTQPRGLGGLPVMFWMMASFGLALFLLAMVVTLANPSARNRVFGVMAVCQAGNLLFIAVESTLDLGLPAPFARWDTPLRMAFDLFTAAAMAHAACLHPRRLPGAGPMALAVWSAATVLVMLVMAGVLPQAWWWTQGTGIGLGLFAIAMLTWSYRIEPHPFAIVLRRFGIVTVATWALLTAALASTDRQSGWSQGIADIGPMVWYVFLGSMLFLVPFLARSQGFMREFSLLAAISTVCTSLDLLFISVFSFGQFTSLTLSLFVSLAVYAGVRQWILNQLLGSSMLTTERMFEQLYRIAREVEAHPQRAPALLTQMLDELFEPLEIGPGGRQSQRTRLTGDGSGMVVPVPAIGSDVGVDGAVTLRFAQRGRRLFTLDDARLTDRVIEQLRRAVRFDKAVEQGRSEERLRLAQDLHDDIGARLLTLMYTAQSKEMEDYVRHTLQDLKTLTRGLAAANHRLSHAAAEWKSDLSHRLDAARIELRWQCTFDEDIALTVVHWSALTRILRELVSNAIAHADARRLEVDLTISDDGVGREPSRWAHGLGLGGVRKRVKQLGGEIEWSELQPRGIRCRVVIHDLTARA